GARAPPAFGAPGAVGAAFGASATGATAATGVWRSTRGGRASSHAPPRGRQAPRGGAHPPLPVLGRVAAGQLGTQGVLEAGLGAGAQPGLPGFGPPHEQDLARLFHLLGAEKSRLSAVCFCRALGEEPEALSPCSKASKAAVPKVLRIAGPSWQQLGRDFAWAKVAEAGSDEALRAFVQRWRPKKAPKAAIAPPPKSAAGEKPAVGPKEPKELRASEARSRASSYSSEDFEGSNQSYSESFASETVTLRRNETQAPACAGAGDLDLRVVSMCSL
ncbi:unnamed protein product, partial [Effrenium voratum]